MTNPSIPGVETMSPKYLRPGFDFALAHAIEEAGEFLAAAGKTQRWGRLSVNPELPPPEQETNVDWLMREMSDLEGALTRLWNELGGRPLAWAPIETAPKDGTRFLAYSQDLTGSDLPPFISMCGWDDSGGFCTDELREPTHWMPLPEPPQVSA